MIDLYIPQKINTNIKGLWLDNTGKPVIDNHKITVLPSIDFVNLEKTRIEYNQECLFYIDKLIDKGFIFYSKNKIECLQKHRRIVFAHDRYFHYLPLIKNLLQQYKGLTVTENEDQFIIDIYYD